MVYYHIDVTTSSTEGRSAGPERRAVARGIASTEHPRVQEH